MKEVVLGCTPRKQSTIAILTDAQFGIGEDIMIGESRFVVETLSKALIEKSGKNVHLDTYLLPLLRLTVNFGVKHMDEVIDTLDLDDCCNYLGFDAMKPSAKRGQKEENRKDEEAVYSSSSSSSSS